jgi:hypothetical protein
MLLWVMHEIQSSQQWIERLKGSAFSFQCSIVQLYGYRALKINLQCCTTQTSFRGEIFHDFPRNLVKITQNRGNFGVIIAPRIVVRVPSLQQGGP